MNGEAISETDWGSFQSLKERKTKRLLLLEVGISIKRQRSDWKEPFGGAHFRARTHVCWIFSRMYSLVSVQRLM